MNQAKDLLGAFAQYFGRDYSMKMAADIADAYSWMNARFKTAIYEEVLRTFTPTNMRPLPDMAAIAAAEKVLPPPSTMVDHSKVKALPEPDLGIEAPKIDIEAMIEKGRRTEYERVQARVKAGNATEAEKRWIENYNKPKRTIPGVKHASELEREAEEKW